MKGIAVVHDAQGDDAKGKEHVLIVRQFGAKMPADLGGDIYASLENKENIEPVKAVMRKFVTGL